MHREMDIEDSRLCADASHRPASLDRVLRLSNVPLDILPGCKCAILHRVDLLRLSGGDLPTDHPAAGGELHPLHPAPYRHLDRWRAGGPQCPAPPVRPLLTAKDRTKERQRP